MTILILSKYEYFVKELHETSDQFIDELLDSHDEDSNDSHDAYNTRDFEIK